MGHYSEITISRSDAKKYSNVSYQGDKVTAKVYINDKGEITKDSYSREHRKELEKEEKKESKKKKEEKKEGCLARILKAPFRLLWWIIKLLLNIVTFGIISSWLNSED